MFDSTDTLSAVSGDGSVKEGLVETAAPTFYIGDTPILRGNLYTYLGPALTITVTIKTLFCLPWILSLRLYLILTSLAHISIEIDI